MIGTVLDWVRERGMARMLRDFALIRVGIWVVLIPVALKLEWAASVIFVTVLSLLALVLSDLAVWSAGRAEVKVDEATVNTESVNVAHADTVTTGKADGMVLRLAMVPPDGPESSARWRVTVSRPNGDHLDTVEATELGDAMEALGSHMTRWIGPADVVLG